jgi:hypothetical protein
MSESNVREFAIMLYGSHARSRKLKTRFHDLSPEDVAHWRRIAEEALNWIASQGVMEEENGDDN